MDTIPKCPTGPSRNDGFLRILDAEEQRIDRHKHVEALLNSGKITESHARNLHKFVRGAHDLYLSYV